MNFLFVYVLFFVNLICFGVSNNEVQSCFGRRTLLSKIDKLSFLKPIRGQEILCEDVNTSIQNYYKNPKKYHFSVITKWSKCNENCTRIRLKKCIRHSICGNCIIKQTRMCSSNKHEDENINLYEENLNTTTHENQYEKSKKNNMKIISDSKSSSVYKNRLHISNKHTLTKTKPKKNTNISNLTNKNFTVVKENIISKKIRNPHFSIKSRRRKQRRSHYNKNKNGTTNMYPMFSNWSDWARCKNCRTSRFKRCINPRLCRHLQSSIYRQESNCYSVAGDKCYNWIYRVIDTKFESDIQSKCGILQQYHVRQYPRRYLKIIGGKKSFKHSWPWQVAIIDQYNEVFCGGTLISSRWILTAAHCVRHYLRIRINEHDIRYRDGTEIEVMIRKAYKHPYYNPVTVNNDIALLRLPIDVNVTSACLPRRREKLPLRELCTVTGWGKYNERNSFGTFVLHETQIPIVPQSLCRKAYKSFHITSNMFCAGYSKGGRDTCSGDSGGPLVCNSKVFSNVTNQATSVLYGVTSFGERCGMNYGIYTNVQNYLDWIFWIMKYF